ncbi:MAG: glutamyl-tRNA reductase [Planctomycetota bacterium]|jgi:glutamyl-tRNA reductase
MEITVIGINHRTAPVHVRERFSLPGELGERLLRVIRAEKVFAEAVVLDTCNRTEIYGVSGSKDDPLAHLIEHVAQLKGAAPVSDTSVFYRHDGMDAVEHLFRVAASLDSQIVGEHEILGQVKDAYRRALESRTADFIINKLFHSAFRAGKRVHTETDIGRGSASVAQAAVELARHVFSSLEGRAVLLVGAGQTAEQAAEALIREGADTLVVANRTLANAQRLAGELCGRQEPQQAEPVAACRRDEGRDGRTCPALRRLAPQCALEGAAPEPPAPSLRASAIGLDAIADAIGEVDLVICSTGSERPVLTCDALAARLGSVGHPLLIVDIAVPRDVEPGLAELPDVFLYNIDDLDRLVEQNLSRRRQELPRAEAIVRHEVEQFRKWADSQQVVPTIKGLQQQLAKLRKAELDRYGKQLSDADRREVAKFARSLCNKIFHNPITFLHSLAADDSPTEVMEAVDLLRRMFDLDSVERKG